MRQLEIKTAQQIDFFHLLNIFLLHPSHWSLMMSWNTVNIDSGNGLVLDGTKPLPESLLTYHQWSSGAFITESNFSLCSWYWSLKHTSNFIFKMAATFPCQNPTFISTWNTITYTVKLVPRNYTASQSSWSFSTGRINIIFRADSRFAPGQWETFTL